MAFGDEETHIVDIPSPFSGMPPTHCASHADVTQELGNIRASVTGTTLWTQRFESQMLERLERMERKIDGMVGVNGQQNVDLAKLEVKAAMYGAMTAAVVSPIIVGVIAIIFKALS